MINRILFKVSLIYLPHMKTSIILLRVIAGDQSFV